MPVTAAPLYRQVDVAGVLAGTLGRDPGGRYVFTYDRQCPPDHFVSLTMPVRLESYVWPELHPVFAAALPQGPMRAVLEERVTREGTAGPFALLDCCPPAPGRWRVRGADGAPVPEAPRAGPELMTATDARPAFDDLYAQGYRLSPPFRPVPGRSMNAAFARDALYRCDPGEGAEAFNEWCALAIARRAGFEVPDAALSADGRVLRLARIDAAAESRPGIEDLCALQGLAPSACYGASAERLASLAATLCPPVNRTAVRREVFRRQVLAHVLRDGERHLRAYEVLYRTADEVRLAPLSGLSTDWSAPPADDRLRPALSVGGERGYRLRKGTWRRFGAHCALSERESGAIIDWLIAALRAEEQALRAAATAKTLPWIRRLEEYWSLGAADLKAAY